MLFKRGKFDSAAGLQLDWKIECDALTAEDWECIAAVSVGMLPPFYDVLGVPEGGLALADAFKPFCTPSAELILVVDDVWTTGTSMGRFTSKMELPVDSWTGFVAFARGPLGPYAKCFAQINTPG